MLIGTKIFKIILYLMLCFFLHILLYLSTLIIFYNIGKEYTNRQEF